MIGQNYHDSLKSISQEEPVSQKSLIASRQTDYGAGCNAFQQSQNADKVRSFTQLLRKASSRGSHNNHEESKDEPSIQQITKKPKGGEVGIGGIGTQETNKPQYKAQATTGNSWQAISQKNNFVFQQPKQLNPHNYNSILSVDSSKMFS